MNCRSVISHSQELGSHFFVIKPTRCTNFTNLFCHETLHVSDSSSAHHQEFIHCTLSNGVCRTSVEQDHPGRAVPSWSCSKAVWHTPLLSVRWINSWWWADELSKTCRVSWQNKFVKLVHLVGSIIYKFVMMHGHMNVKNLESVCGQSSVSCQLQNSRLSHSRNKAILIPAIRFQPV